MYLEITMRCNMACKHCCLSAGDNNKDMTFDVFKTAITAFLPQLKETNNWISLGGGEPTMHPEFWKYLAYAQSKHHVWLSTNGKKTEDVLILCDLAKQKKIGMRLSLDDFHEPIDSEVVNKFRSGLKETENNAYFTEYTTPFDNRTILTVKTPYKGGRCRDGADVCPCVAMMIKYNGDIYPCGCDDAPKIGDIYRGITDLRFIHHPWSGTCYKDTLKINNEFNVNCKQYELNDRNAFTLK